MNPINQTRVKLFTILLIINLLLIYRDLLRLVIYLWVIILALVIYNKLFWKYFKWLKAFIVPAIIIILVQVFISGEGSSIFEKISLGISAVIRLISIASLILLFIETTKITLIIQSLSFLPRSITFVLGLALSLVPRLSKEIREIMTAQQARGHKKGWNIFKTYIPILVPSFSKSLIRAEKIAIAMQTRGFEI